MSPEVHAVLGARPPTEWRPIGLVSDRAPPALLVHGLEDPTIHPMEAVHMSEKLRAAGVSVECRIYESAGHLATVLAISPLLRIEGHTLADAQVAISSHRNSYGRCFISVTDIASSHEQVRSARPPARVVFHVLIQCGSRRTSVG